MLKTLTMRLLRFNKLNSEVGENSPSQWGRVPLAKDLQATQEKPIWWDNQHEVLVRNFNLEYGIKATTSTTNIKGLRTSYNNYVPKEVYQNDIHYNLQVDYGFD
jgi:hypothetical protein